jgi:hypothetical protein
VLGTVIVRCLISDAESFGSASIRLVIVPG